MKLSVVKDGTNEARGKTVIDFHGLPWHFSEWNVHILAKIRNFFQAQSRAQVYQMSSELFLPIQCIQTQITIALQSAQALCFCLINFLLVLHFLKGKLFAHMIAPGLNRFKS